MTEIAKRQGWRPFAFLSNGQDTYFFDDTQRRLVHGFFSKSDLENQLFTRRSGVLLTSVAVNPNIVAQKLEGVRLAQGLHNTLLHDAFSDAWKDQHKLEHCGRVT